MESIYTELALYWSKTECAMTDNVFSPIYLRSAMIRFPLREADNWVNRLKNQKFKMTLYTVQNILNTVHSIMNNVESQKHSI